MLQFDERTIRVVIDDSKCPQCKTKACIKACSLYDRGILKLKSGRPAVLDIEEAKRIGTDCLGCEYECQHRGLKAINISVPISGLDEYRKSAASELTR